MKTTTNQLKLVVLSLLFVFSTIAVNAQVAINAGGGTAAAGSMLDVTSTNEGVLIPRVAYGAISGLAVQGLLVYVTSGGPSGNGFYYYEGTSWKRLSDGTGILPVAAGGTGTGTAFAPGSVVFAGASGVYTQDNANFFWNNSNQRLGLGIPTPFSNLHIYEMNNELVPASIIEQNNSINGTSGDAAMQYILTLSNGIATNITTGIDENDNSNFEISNAPTLTGSVYTDPNTMMRVHTVAGSDGITDFNHQSRARAYLANSQFILPAIWTPIEYDAISYNEHGEFFPSSGSGNPGQFIALEDGYYQVNARAEFAVLEGSVGQGYVSIAIFKNGIPYAVGNNLQMTLLNNELMEKNNAPNVSDVLDLVAGDRIEIFVYQTFTPSGVPAILKVTDTTFPGPLGQETPAVTYVSIHKIS